MLLYLYDSMSFLTCIPVLECIKKGEDYVALSKAISINILDFEYLDIEVSLFI